MTAFRYAHFVAVFLLGILVFSGPPAAAATDETSASQNEYEKSIGAIVRNKRFYKAGKLELGILGGLTPYDSVFTTYSVGGHLTWHLGDHYGWEVLDATIPFSSVAGFTNDLVTGKTISDMEAVQLKTLVGTNFLFSPVYGKIRFFGSQVTYFDMYLVAGGGMANTQTLKFRGVSGSTVQSTIKSGWDPMVDFGIGFKILTRSSLSIIVDLRDYVTLSQAYGSTSPRSNFFVALGVSYFIPHF